VSLQDRLSALITAIGADFKKTTKSLVYSASGTLTVRTGVSKIPMQGSGTIVAVKAYVNTAPTGASLIVDVNKNGTTIFGTQSNRPTVAAGANAATVGANSVTTYVDGDLLSVDIDQIGSTIAGSDLVVVVYVLRTT
jgi:hypothetical protein